MFVQILNHIFFVKSIEGGKEIESSLTRVIAALLRSNHPRPEIWSLKGHCHAIVVIDIAQAE